MTDFPTRSARSSVCPIPLTCSLQRDYLSGFECRDGHPIAKKNAVRRDRRDAWPGGEYSGKI